MDVFKCVFYFFKLVEKMVKTGVVLFSAFYAEQLSKQAAKLPFKNQCQCTAEGYVLFTALTRIT